MTPIRTAVTPPGRRWWIATVALVVAGLGTAAWLAAVTPLAFPFGDVAIIEVTTAAALRTPVTLGPYSQFGWHHPGPLLFYLLAPFYAAAGANSIGLSVGAIALNLLALGVTGRTLARHVGPAVAATVVLALGLYLLRAGDLVTSIWNPHLIVLPLVAAMVLAAAAGAGDGAALVGTVFAVSFLAQSSVSVVPVCAVVAAAGIGWPPTNAWLVRRRWVVGAASLLLLAWLPPLVEQATHQPGNIASLARFFVSAPSDGQTWRVAVLAWSDITTAMLRPDVELPWGQAFERPGSPGTIAMAAAQVLALVGVAVWARRRGHLVLSRLAWLTVVVSLVACWSITRIARDISDYQIFWMSAVGALGVALVAGAAALAATSDAPGRRRALIGSLGVLLAVALALTVPGGLVRARQYAVTQRDQQAPRRVVALATVEYLRRERLVRPLFRMNATSWLQATGVVLHAYRALPGAAVAREWVPVFGEALQPDGSEDVELEIGGGCPAGRAIVARADGLCVFAVEPSR